MKRWMWLWLCVFVAPVAWADEAVLDVKDAIVKIYTYHAVPDYQSPWSMRGTFNSTGSGCIIKGKRILTNAHVVSDQTFIQVRRNGDSRRYEARVVSVSHAADVALLSVEDPAFFEGVEPLDLGTLPNAQQEVLVYGFPLGGDTLSITKGVISRIEHQTYTHSSCSFLAVQIDAALNPGNSGGPAIVDDKVVGVAMQGISQADNIGYIVPVPIIDHFLADMEDGRYDGFPSLGVVMQGMENPDLKNKYDLLETQSGMLVVQTLRGSPAEGNLQSGDVLISIEGREIADDGTVEFRPKQRTSMSYFIQEKQIGEKVRVGLLRAGEQLDVEVALDRPMEKDRLIPLEQYDRLPTYFIFGGLVISPLSVNYLKSWGPNWYDTAPEELVGMLGANFVTDEADEVVLLQKVLASEVGRGYQDIANWVITEVNGQKIKNLRELVQRVDEADAGSFVVFKNKLGNQIVIQKEKAAQSLPKILETYRIQKDRSPDLEGPL